MRIARSLFILAIASVIYSVVKAMDIYRSPLQNTVSPLSDEVMDELEYIKGQVKLFERNRNEGLMSQMATLQLDPKQGAMAPILSQDQASISRMEIDGEARHGNMGTVDFMRSRNDPVTWLETLLSKVDEHEMHLSRNVVNIAKEYEDLERSIEQHTYRQDLISKLSRAHSDYEEAKSRLNEIRQGRKDLAKLLEEVKAALNTDAGGPEQRRG